MIIIILLRFILFFPFFFLKISTIDRQAHTLKHTHTHILYIEREQRVFFGKIYPFIKSRVRIASSSHLRKSQKKKKSNNKNKINMHITIEKGENRIKRKQKKNK